LERRASVIFGGFARCEGDGRRRRFFELGTAVNLRKCFLKASVMCAERGPSAATDTTATLIHSAYRRCQNVVKRRGDGRGRGRGNFERICNHGTSQIVDATGAAALMFRLADTVQRRAKIMSLHEEKAADSRDRQRNRKAKISRWSRYCRRAKRRIGIGENRGPATTIEAATYPPVQAIPEDWQIGWVVD